MKQENHFLIESLHIFVLCSLAFAQPLFDLLSKHAEFFSIRRSEPVDIILLVFCLIIILPSLFVLVELMAVLFSWRVRKSVHGFLVAVLLTIIILPALNKYFGLPGAALLVVAVILGVVFTITYIRFHLVRSLLTVLSPVLLVFPSLFLFNSPVFKVVFPGKAPTAVTIKVDDPPPIIMVVFDELPVTSLMDEHRQIDPILYPNFFDLAKNAYWFRNAATVSDETKTSLAAILTGNYPDPRLLPTDSDYPNNIFTLLGGSYDLKISEIITHLCPDQLNDSNFPHDGLVERMHFLVSDMSVIYLHVLLPTDLTSFLPDVRRTWKDFKKKLSAKKENNVRLFRKFIENINSAKRPTLFFLHSVLPHHPWIYLPSGKKYVKYSISIGGRFQNEWESIHYFQRHLLQVGFVDKLLGELMDRLKEVGLYDRSLIIITADHGISFKLNEVNRFFTKSNYPDIMSVPLIIKAPYQQKGEIIDRNVALVDILPTITETLEINLPWQVDGRSVFNTSLPERRQIGPFLLDGLKDKYLTLEKKLALFGSGKVADGLFKIGSYKNLIGKRLSEVSLVGVEGVVVELDSKSNYENVNSKAEFVPSLITGRVISRGHSGLPYNLAISVNNTIRAVTETFKRKGNVVRFSAIVPETSFRTGRNDVEIIVVSHAEGQQKLENAMRRTSVTYSLNCETITSSDGKTFQIIPGALSGRVDAALDRGDKLTFLGWSADVKNFNIPEAVLIFIKGKFFYSGHNGVYKPDVVKVFGNDALKWAGFVYQFPLEPFKGLYYPDVRFFAISKDGVASELNYNKKYRW
jgi:hypothetical protein